METGANTRRQFELDCLKFFAIPFMTCVHIYEKFGLYDYYGELPDSLFQNVIEFLGGPLAAPVFMFCMGIGMIYTRHNTSHDFIMRGFKLLIMGYVLNFFRRTFFQIILWLAGIQFYDDPIGNLLIVDILQFAGMAFIFIGILKRLNVTIPIICLIAVVLQAAGIWTERLNIEPLALQNIIGLLLPVGEYVAFPMFLWLVYPAFGMLFAEYFQKVEDKTRFCSRLMAVSAVFFTALTSALVYIGYDIRLFYCSYLDSYYHQTLISTLWTMAVIILALGFDFFVFGKLEQTKIGSFIRFCSINLNTIYIIHWIIIGLTAAVIEFLGMEGTTSPVVIVTAGIILFVLSAEVTFIFLKMRRLCD